MANAKKTSKKAVTKRRSADRPKVVAITGALGFLGRRVLRRLEAVDDIERIVAIDVRDPVELVRREGESEDPAHILDAHHKVSAHMHDLAEVGSDRVLAEIFAREGVDAVCHLAFLSNPTHQQTLAHELETIGTMHVLHACRATSVRRLVSLSSTMCYGARPDNPAVLTEDDPLRAPARSSFLADKQDADRQVLRFAEQNPDVTCAVLRMGAMLGGSKTRNFWTRYFTRPAVTTVLGYDPMFQFLDADDAVGGIVTTLLSRAEGPLNLVGRGVLPLSHIVGRLGRRRVALPAGLATSALRALWTAQLIEMPPHFVSYLRWSWICDGSRLERETGFAPSRDIDAVLAHVNAEFS